MSKYTDWLNKKGAEALENGVNAVDFVRICAWGAKEMAYYHPEELEPLVERIPLDQTELNKKLQEANDDLERIPDDNDEGTDVEGGLGKEDYYKAACEEKEAERLAEIAAAENLIALYGSILADLCIWNPEEPTMKALKAFAIKELTTNMPNIAKYANPQAVLPLDKFFSNLYNEKASVVSRIMKEIKTESDANAMANDYIDDLEKDITSLEEIVSKVPTEEQANRISL